MAKGSEHGEIVSSPLRTGMKREFVMLLKDQAECGISIKAQVECGISIGQKRVTRSQLSQNSPTSAKVSVKKQKKAVKNGKLLNVKRVGEELETDGMVKRVEKMVSANKQKREVTDGVVSEDLPNDKTVGEELESSDPSNDRVNVKKRKIELINGSVGEGLSSCKAVGVELESNSAVKAEEDVVMGSEEDEPKSDSGVVKNVVLLSEENQPKSDGGVVKNVILLSEEDEPKSDVVDCCNSDDDEKKGRMDEEVVGSEDKKIIKEEDNTKTEMAKTVSASDDGSVEAMPESVPELAVTALGDGKDELNCEDDAKTEMAKTLKANDCILEEAVAEIVPGLAVTAQSDAKKDEQKVLCETPTRRLTRSALKAKEDVKLSQCDSIKVEELHEPVSVETVSAPLKLELKMSKKVALTKNRTKLKDLLETGLLEGLTVRYIRGTKVKGHHEVGLQGEIRGSGILCFCDRCHGTSVVTPNQFELHAGSSNKRPPEYIYLPNGKTLRDVLSLCKGAPSDELEVAIRNAIGSTNAELVASASMPAMQELTSIPAQIIEASSRSTPSVPVKKLTYRMPSGSGTQSKGKLTRKDIRMHKLVFEEDGLLDGTALAYYVRGQKLLEGFKKGHGIFCYCCNTEVSPSQFEAHAGCASRRKPYLYIYTSNGVSLHELSIKLSKERKSSAEENDDLCSICADGGDLLCCDNCPRAFHTECVSLPSIPTGTWYCKYCQNMFAKERFVETNANAIAAGRVAGIDALEQITKRCIRMVEALDYEVSVCVLCRSQDFSKSGFGPRTVIICDQCEKEYHIGCLKEHNIDDLKELPHDKWFCCTDCSRIHFALEKLVSEGEQNIPETYLKVLKEKKEGKDPENNSSLDIKWRLLSGNMSPEETRVWLSGAVSIFHDQFDPIENASTGRADLIPHMVYGRKFKDQDYGGNFCAILLVDSLVVSAGIIRIFGKEVAELPLVATSAKFQGQGYFQSLFACIENLLESLNVENLVLPSATETESIWTNKFGFKKLPEEKLKHYRKSHQMMVFSGTAMLQKPVGGS